MTWGRKTLQHKLLFTFGGGEFKSKMLYSRLAKFWMGNLSSESGFRSLAFQNCQLRDPHGWMMNRAADCGPAVQWLRGFLSRDVTRRGNGYDRQMRLVVAAKKCVHGRDKVKRPIFFLKE